MIVCDTLCMAKTQTVRDLVARGITPSEFGPVTELMARREADVREGRLFCEKHQEWSLNDCPKCEAEKPVPPTAEEQLSEALSLLVRTVWDTMKDSESAHQWDSLSECASDAVKLMQRLEGRRESCTPWPNPITGKQRKARKS